MTPTERKLAAILSADVVGYSRMMAEDESRGLGGPTLHYAAYPLRHRRS